jgi:hypothetical protein
LTTTVGRLNSLTSLHVPLGVIVILVAVALAVWAWRLRPPATRSIASPKSVEPVKVRAVVATRSQREKNAADVGAPCER